MTLFSRLSLVSPLLLLLLLIACGGDDNEQAATEIPPEATGALQQVEPTEPPTEPSATAPPSEPATSTSTPQATATPPESEPTAIFTAAPPEVEPTATAPNVPIVRPVRSLHLAPTVQGFDNPTFLTNAGDERLFVLEQVGRIQLVENGEIAPQPFLDITDRVGFNSNEQGLLGLAFHPDYAGNGQFFVDYTDANGNTIVSRFQVSGDPNLADRDSELVILAVQQPFPNHNGGQLLFGPDGYLYVGLGDGGSGGDPHNNGQNPATLLGSILRLDVDNSTADEPYAIPPDNPFASEAASGAPEVWAYGLRNPWRFSFDPVDQTWYIADVGQNQYEEVDAVPAAQASGANYGWNIMEGLHCYGTEECDPEGLRLPVVEYSHAQGGCSVTGGYVYRGAQYEALAGNYFFGDYCSGYIWALRQDEQGQWSTGQGALVTVQGQVTSFGLDSAGGVYVVTREGVIYQIQP